MPKRKNKQSVLLADDDVWNALPASEQLECIRVYIMGSRLPDAEHEITEKLRISVAICGAIRIIETQERAMRQLGLSTRSDQFGLCQGDP